MIDWNGLKTHCSVLCKLIEGGSLVSLQCGADAESTLWPLCSDIGWETCCFLSFVTIHEEFDTMLDKKTSAAPRSIPSVANNCIHFQKNISLHIYCWYDELTWVLFGWMGCQREGTGQEGLWCLCSKSLSKVLQTSALKGWSCNYFYMPIKLGHVKRQIKTEWPNLKLQQAKIF